MVTRLLAACLLMASCVIIHAVGMTSAIRRLRQASATIQGFWPGVGLLILVATWMVLLHLSEIVVWALAYWWNGALADFRTAMYFSAVTYTTTGYGDVVLPVGWRLDGGVEALTGILMCGWSTGFFFAIFNRLYDPRPSALPS